MSHPATMPTTAEATRRPEARLKKAFVEVDSEAGAGVPTGAVAIAHAAESSHEPNSGFRFATMANPQIKTTTTSKAHPMVQPLSTRSLRSTL